MNQHDADNKDVIKKDEWAVWVCGCVGVGVGGGGVQDSKKDRGGRGGGAHTNRFPQNNRFWTEYSGPPIYGHPHQGSQMTLKPLNNGL